MTDLLRNLSKELGTHFECNESLDQLQSNLLVLAEQLQLLITAINQNRFMRGVLCPDIGIAAKIKLIECLAREATQMYRNAETETQKHRALDKEIRRRKRVLRKLRRSSNHDGERREFIRATRRSQPMSNESSKHSFSLSPIRESIPLPPPTPRLRIHETSAATRNNSSSTIDANDVLEFDLV